MVTLQEIIEDITRCFDITIPELKEKLINRDNIRLKQLYCYVAKSRTTRSMRLIADKIGYKNYSSAIRAYRVIDKYINNNDPDFIDVWSHYTTRSRVWNKNLKNANA